MAHGGSEDRNVQHLRERQDVELAALESANSGVAVARSGLTKHMLSANDCCLPMAKACAFS